MFETVSPEMLIRRDRPIFYRSLPLSIALHGLVLLGITASAFYRLSFPLAPPRLAFSYLIADLNPPPPPPPPPPPARAAQPVSQPVEVPLDKIVAPTMIPDQIPVVAPTPVLAAEVAPTGPAVPVEGAVDGGVIGGMVGGVVGGVLAGQPKPVLGGLLLDDGKVHFAKDTQLPLYVEHQEYPEYPESARNKGQEDTVTVRYIIDLKGRVREIIVLDHAERPVFEEAALKAIRGWRFRPLVVDGQPREVVHDLTVFFRLK